MSSVYSIRDAKNLSSINTSLFIMASGDDERTLAMINHVKAIDNHIKTIVLVKYHEDFDDSFLSNDFPESKIIILSAIGEQSDFLTNLRPLNEDFITGELFIDITSIRIPEMFIMLKYLYHVNEHLIINAVYSTPFDYVFPQEPFTSYQSYYGDFKTLDILGYGGISDDMSYTQMFIFLGFEGLLSTKVNEDIQYNTLRLVNNLPSFYDKYKDISILNNYELLNSSHDHLFYVPADNPFETYNFLTEHIDDNEHACIAPLSSKPVALGICLYSLYHNHIRVVYPTAETYSKHITNSVLCTHIFSFSLK